MSRFDKMLGVALAALVAGASMARAEELPQGENMRLLYVGTLKDVQGVDGRPPAEGSYIEFRTMYKAGSGPAGWITYAPESMWIESRNPLKATSKVGCGVIPSARGRGLFAACVSGLGKNTQYVARVFSGPTPEESVAYCDSRPFVYTGDNTRAVTNVTFNGVWKAMDGSALEDTDGDGLFDLVEEKISDTDPGNWDMDGDGFSDGFEHTHYMDPKEKYYLAIRLATTPVDEELLDADELPMSYYDVTWASISGLTYNLEYVDDITAEDGYWVGVTNVTATGTNMTVPVDELHFYNPRGFFRVWTVLPEPTQDNGD